jgi:hypothetical protein
MRQAPFSKSSTTFHEQTHVSLWNSKTYQKTEISHMAKLFVTTNLTKRERTRDTHGGW